MKIELKVPKKIPRIPMAELKKILAKQGIQSYKALLDNTF
jgi:hypothetical protein